MSFVITMTLLAVMSPSAAATDRTDIPLKNWGGFARFRDQVYDDLERLAASGLVGPAVLSTKPLSRTEAARIVARAIQTVRRAGNGSLSDQRGLEPVLERLADEFRVELAAMGVKQSDDLPPPRFLAVVPVDRGQVALGYTNHDRALVNNQGLRFEDGANVGGTFDSRLQVGDFLSFYVQPELVANEELGAARLAQGYAKLTLFNVEVAVGRESLWWGPALHGSLILSNNAAPLDHVRIGAAEPFRLPLVGKWLGPMDVLFFVAQLEKRSDHKRPKLAGMRASIAPASFLELGASRTVMFDGEERLKLADYPEALFRPDAGDEPGKFRNNNLFAIDGDLRLANVRRWGLPMRDLRLYGEFGWDDTCCESNFIPLRTALSGLAGVHLLGLFGQEGLEARAEYARTSRLSFTHSFFLRGYQTRRDVISHFIGTEGEDFYVRATNRVNHNVMLGIEGNRAVIGSTDIRFKGPKERRLAGAIDLSWRFRDRYALFAQYEGALVDNRNFRSGDDGIDHMFRIEITRSFR